MLATTRAFDVAVPLLLPVPLPIDEATALAFARTALPPDGCQRHADLDWPALTAHITAAGGICVRRVENLADAELSVDFLGAEDAVGEVAFICRQH
jgi:hypothetical protein